MPSAMFYNIITVQCNVVVFLLRFLYTSEMKHVRVINSSGLSWRERRNYRGGGVNFSDVGGGGVTADYVSVHG